MPRSTQDADVVIEADGRSIEDLLLGLSPGYCVPQGLAREAARAGGMFNVIHQRAAFKVDLIVCGGDALAREQLARRRQAAWGGRPAWFAAPADVIVSKLRWVTQGGGEGHLRDCAGILGVQGAAIDRDVLRQLAQRSGVLGLLEPLLRAEAAGTHSQRDGS